MGYTCLKSDASFYVFTRGEVRIEIPVYVDDITISVLELGENSTRRLTDTDTLQSELSNYPNTKKK